MPTRTFPSPAVEAMPCDAAQLGAREVALVHPHDHGGVAGLPLLDHVAFEPRVVRRVLVVVRLQHREQRAIAQRLRLRLVAAEAFRNHVGPGDAAVGEDILVFLFDLFLEPLEAALAHDEFHAGLVLVLAVAVAVENAEHRFALVEQALFGEELFQQLRLGGQRTEAAADHHAETAPAVADRGPQADIVDGALHAIARGAAVERELELARQVAGEILAQKRVSQSLGVGAHVEDLVVGDAGPGAGGDVAHRVVAGFAIGQAGVGQHVHEIGHPVQRDEVELHVLAGGEVAPAAAELVGDAGKLVRSGRRWRGRSGSCSAPSGRPAGAGRKCRASGDRDGIRSRESPRPGMPRLSRGRFRFPGERSDRVDFQTPGGC